MTIKRAVIVIKRFGFKKVLLTSTKKRFRKIVLSIKPFFFYRCWLAKGLAFLMFLAKKNNDRSPLWHEEGKDLDIEESSPEKYPSSSYVVFLKKIG